MNGGGGIPPARAIISFCLLLLVAGALQGTIAGRLPRAWGEPDFVLTLALVAGLLSDATIGGAAGLAAGLVTASLVGQTVGTFLVSRTLAGYIAGWTTARLYRGNVFVVVPGVLVMSLLSEAIYLLAAPRVGLGVGLKAALLGAVGNALLAAPMLWLLRRCGWGTRL
jgi:hypothetical protein